MPLTPSAPRRPLSASSQRSSTAVTRQGWIPPPSTASVNQVESSIAQPTASTPTACAQLASSSRAVDSATAPTSLFGLLPKRQSSTNFRPYGVAARSAKDARTVQMPVERAAETIAPSLPPSVVTTPLVASSSGLSGEAAVVQESLPLTEFPAGSASSSLLPKPKEDASTPQQQRSTPTSLEEQQTTRLTPPSWANLFPQVGHYVCPCGLPICTAAAKCRSLGGYPTFCRYFGPSLQLQLTLPTGVNAYGATATFSATCTACGCAIGYIPLNTTVLTSTGGLTGACDDEGVHALRVTNTQMQYRGQKAPPEYASLEVAALTPMDESNGCDRRVSGARMRHGLTATQRTTQKEVRKTADTDESTSSEDEETDSAASDDDLWVQLRSQAKCRTR